MSISTIRRQVKNVAYNFSDAQVKVREATSNDPWGPSTALMSEIADLTNNPMAFTEIMSIVWKRLNDSGKNWRHVYKSLVLLDFLIKCGNEKVAQQCRENIFTIETLKDFQHIEENRDQGLNIREKAKQIVSLLSDEERLKNERTRFMLTRNKFKQNYPSSYSDSVGAVGSSGSRNRSRIDHPSSGAALDPEFEEARPANQTEEEMQLQIALALSREEHEKMDEMRKSDEVRLQLALEESRKEAEKMATQPQGTVHSGQLSQSALDDLLSLGVGELISNTPADQPSSSAWGNNSNAGSSSMGGLIDPWATPTQPFPPAPAASASLYPSNQLSNDPWAPAPAASAMAFSSAVPTAASTVDPFSAWDSPTTHQAPVTSTVNNDFNNLLLPTTSDTNGSSSGMTTNGTSRKTPENFLGENKNLVNLDDLLGTSSGTLAASNPFLLSSTPAAPTNPFQAAQRKSPTLNEMRAAQQAMPPIPQSAPRVAPQANPFQSPF